MRQDPQRHGGAVAGGEVGRPRRLPAAGQPGDIHLARWRRAGPVAEAQDPAPDLRVWFTIVLRRDWREH